MIEEFRSIELRELSDDELYHHGILGMSWGKRNGPPYPLTGADKKFAKAEAKRKKEKERQLEKMQAGLKKARKAKRRADKKMRKQLMKEEKKLKKKQQLLERDNYKEIMKNSKLFTTQELREIQNRHEQMRIEKLDRFLTRATKFTATVNTIANVANGFDQIRKLNRSIKMDDIDLATSKLKLQEQAEKMGRDTKKFEYELASKKYEADKAKEMARMQSGLADQNRMKAIQERNKALTSMYESNAKIAEEAAKRYETMKDLIPKIQADQQNRVTKMADYASPASGGFSYERSPQSGIKNAKIQDFLVTSIPGSLTKFENDTYYNLLTKPNLRRDWKATPITKLY